MASWIRRLGSTRSGFRYVDANGRPVRDRRTLERLEHLRVPPAWRDVHLATTARSAIQAWGFDARGRKQYRYNERAVERRELRKYHRLRQLAKAMPKVRETLREHAQPNARVGTLVADTVAATVLRLISETFCRVGGERYAKENGTFGITTLRKSHVQTKNGLTSLVYRGKGNIKQRQIIHDQDLSKLLKRQLGTPGTRLFRYRREGEWRTLTARDVNNYMRRHIGKYSAKDFRTWGGTLRAATVLAELGPAKSPSEAKRNVALAMRLVSSELGNTPTICRKSYVHPIVVARYLDEGDTISLPRARLKAADRGRAFSPEERSLIAFLDEHFPERRESPREEG